MSYSFGAQDLLALLGVSAADFEIKSINPKTSTKQAGVKTRLNAYVPASVVQFDELTEYEIQLEAKNPAGAAATFSLGGSGGGTGSNVVITKAAARMEADKPATLSVTCHTHATVTTHESAPAAVAITTPSLGFGILAFPAIDGTLPDELQSADWGVEMEHKDYVSRVGAHLTGHSSAIKYTWAYEMLDTGTAPTLTSGYKQESVDLPEVQEGLRMRKASGYMYP